MTVLVYYARIDGQFYNYWLEQIYIIISYDFVRYNSYVSDGGRGFGPYDVIW